MIVLLVLLFFGNSFCEPKYHQHLEEFKYGPLPAFNLEEHVSDVKKEVPDIVMQITKHIEGCETCHADMFDGSRFTLSCDNKYRQFIKSNVIPVWGDIYEPGQFLMRLIEKLGFFMIPEAVMSSIDSLNYEVSHGPNITHEALISRYTKAFEPVEDGRALLRHLLIFFSSFIKEGSVFKGISQISETVSKDIAEKFYVCSWMPHCSEVSRDAIVSIVLDLGPENIFRILGGVGPYTHKVHSNPKLFFAIIPTPSTHRAAKKSVQPLKTRPHEDVPQHLILTETKIKQSDENSLTPSTGSPDYSVDLDISTAFALNKGENHPEALMDEHEDNPRHDENHPHHHLHHPHHHLHHGHHQHHHLHHGHHQHHHLHHGHHPHHHLHHGHHHLHHDHHPHHHLHHGHHPRHHQHHGHHPHHHQHHGHHPHHHLHHGHHPHHHLHHGHDSHHHLHHGHDSHHHHVHPGHHYEENQAHHDEDHRNSWTTQAHTWMPANMAMQNPYKSSSGAEKDILHSSMPYAVQPHFGSAHVTFPVESSEAPYRATLRENINTIEPSSNSGNMFYSIRQSLDKLEDILAHIYEEYLHEHEDFHNYQFSYNQGPEYPEGNYGQAGLESHHIHNLSPLSHKLTYLEPARHPLWPQN